MILFTADWHLKLGQKNVPKKWALNRYELFFEAIREKEKTCKMHIIGGDLFEVAQYGRIRIILFLCI